jgi:murein DD-endopeptidase MepM/ murein hydrolase activator NlpD
MDGGGVRIPDATILLMKLRLAVLVIPMLGACSQRAPWRFVSVTPMPAATKATAESTAASSTPALSIPMAVTDATTVAHLQSLYFPVPGEDSTRLDDSFDAPRDGGARKHNAIDIMAPKGTPILSVQDGRVLKLSRNPKGGITVYATDLEEHYVYYYAHLDHYQPNLYAGKPLMRGDTLGYVGTTGNASANLPHLHFQVMHMPSDRSKFWNGEPINPYPMLRQTATTASAEK